MAQTPREEIIGEIKVLLGDGMQDLDLDPIHYKVAVDRALMRYRQRSGNALEESFLFIDVQPDNSSYTLPNEVQEIRAVYRKTIGSSTGSGAAVDPFSLGFTNNIYMMQGGGGMGGGGTGSLATYDLAMGYQNLVGRMFGREILYTWNAASKVILFERKFSGTEQIGLHVYMTKPESILFIDPYARIWLLDYAKANCKHMLGEARSKFASYAGPQGGISFNGSEMKTEATAEMERLDNELKEFFDSHMGMPFLFG